MSEYKLPEPAIYDAGGKQFGYSNVQMQQAYIAGRDAMREEAVKVCEDMQQGWASESHLACAKAIKELK